MCIFIAGKKKNISEIEPDDFLYFSQQNTDGMGIGYYHDGIIRVRKIYPSPNTEGKIMEELKEIFGKMDDEDKMIVHFRFATSGKDSVESVHPFAVQDSNYIIAHNGVITGLGNEQKSDTIHFVEFLSKLDKKWYKDKIMVDVMSALLTGSKFAILNTNNELTLINPNLGKIENEVWYSKTTIHRPKKSYSSIYTNGYHERGTTCDICGAWLWTDKERFSGICDRCAKKNSSNKIDIPICKVCKQPLIYLGEIAADMCEGCIALYMDALKEPITHKCPVCAKTWVEEIYVQKKKYRKSFIKHTLCSKCKDFRPVDILFRCIKCNDVKKKSMWYKKDIVGKNKLKEVKYVCYKCANGKPEESIT